MKIFSIGHSNRSQEEFGEILAANKIEMLVDVRHFPGSRTHPQFKQENMIQWLKEDHDIVYKHLVDLGGHRTKKKDLVDVVSPVDNSGWTNKGFEDYANYTHSSQWMTAFEQLKDLASRNCVAYMCSEAVPWRCHRRLITDVLLSEDWDVFDLMSKKPEIAKLPKHAVQVSRGLVSYPSCSCAIGD